MTKDEFVSRIKLTVADGAIDSIESILAKPPGKQPEKEILKLSAWFNNLREDEREMVKKVISESVRTAIFGFFCVLDGVRAIDSEPDKGRLILNYENNGLTVWLNNPDDDFLHDLL